MIYDIVYNNKAKPPMIVGQCLSTVTGRRRKLGSAPIQYQNIQSCLLSNSVRITCADRLTAYALTFTRTIGCITVHLLKLSMKLYIVFTLI